MLEVASGKVSLKGPNDEKAWTGTKFREILDGYFGNNRSSASYTKRPKVSRRNLRSQYRQWYDGRAFLGVFIDWLFSEVEYRILATDEPIKLIGLEFGFKSLQDFRAYFVRYKGISPKGLRDSRSKQMY